MIYCDAREELLTANKCALSQWNISSSTSIFPLMHVLAMDIHHSHTSPHILYCQTLRLEILVSMILPIVSQHLLRLQCLDMLHLALPHSLCTSTPDFVHLLRHDCQNNAPSTLLAMSTACHQMSPHILPSLLRFGHLPPSRPQCYVSSLPHQQGPVVPCFGSLSLLTHLAQLNWPLFEYSEFLDLHNVGFHFVSSPEFEQELPEGTHALELLACTSASHQCCVSSLIPIIHFLPPN